MINYNKAIIRRMAIKVDLIESTYLDIFMEKILFLFLKFFALIFYIQDSFFSFFGLNKKNCPNPYLPLQQIYF